MNDQQQTVHLWFQKADNDLKTAKDELITSQPATDTVCFHAQQCAEKYLKAYLVHNNREIRKTHNLALILKDCIEADNSFLHLREEQIEILTPYATTYRYPDDFYIPPLEEAKEAVRKAELVTQFVIEKTGPSVSDT